MNVAVKTLAEYLKTAIPELKQVLTEWPDPKVQMSLPCVSIVTAGTPDYTHLMPTIQKKSDSDSPLQKQVVYLVGQYDSRLQVDVWCEYKSQRDEFLEKVMDAFNGQFLSGGQTTGLSLELIDYHNAIARYDQVGYTYLDSEDNSIRSEWRVKVDVLANYPRLSMKQEYIMDEIKIKNRIDEYVDAINDTTNEETTV